MAENCSICLSSLDKNIVTSSVCGHCFHIECYEQLAAAANRNNTSSVRRAPPCPLCHKGIEKIIPLYLDLGTAQENRLLELQRVVENQKRQLGSKTALIEKLENDIVNSSTSVAKHGTGAAKNKRQKSFKKGRLRDKSFGQSFCSEPCAAAVRKYSPTAAVRKYSPLKIRQGITSTASCSSSTSHATTTATVASSEQQQHPPKKSSLLRSVVQRRRNKKNNMSSRANSMSSRATASSSTSTTPTATAAPARGIEESLRMLAVRSGVIEARGTDSDDDTTVTLGGGGSLLPSGSTHASMVRESTYGSGVDDILNDLQESLSRIDHDYRDVRLPSPSPSREDPAASIAAPHRTPPPSHTTAGPKEEGDDSLVERCLPEVLTNVSCDPSVALEGMLGRAGARGTASPHLVRRCLPAALAEVSAASCGPLLAAAEDGGAELATRYLPAALPDVACERAGAFERGLLSFDPKVLVDMSFDLYVRLNACMETSRKDI